MTQPAALDMRTASIASEMEPIWFTLRRRALHALASMAVATRSGLVTRRSSPTTWHTPEPVDAGVLEVILVEGVLDGDDGVLGAELLVHLDHLLTGLLEGAVVVLGLEVKIVHLVLGVELSRGDVHADLDLASVTRVLDGNLEELKALLVLLDVGGEATSSPTLQASCPYLALM